MQEISIDISDSGRILIGDRVFYSSASGGGLIENVTTHEKAFLQRYEDPEAISGPEAFACGVLSSGDNARRLRHVVYPRVFRQQDADVYYTLTEFPPDWESKNIRLMSKAVSLGSFPIYARVMAALNLADVLCVLRDYLGEIILSVHPESIHIDIETGDVYIWIEPWLRAAGGGAERDSFGFPPEWYSREDKSFDEMDLRFFAAYTIFRLLCGEDPFDGSETLLQFPLLTAEAVREMRAGEYGFVFAGGRNRAFGQGFWKKWRALPAFLHRAFEKSFATDPEQRGERTELSAWLELVRKLRDCLVIVNGKSRFCDPEGSYSVLFLVVDDYKIPVWPQKAVYWYHTGTSAAESENGVVAGVTVKNGQYYLSNLSGNVWGATLGNTSLWIYPGKEIEIREGMLIRLENDKVIRVVSGQKDDQSKQTDAEPQVGEGASGNAPADSAGKEE